MARSTPDRVTGFVCQNRQNCDAGDGFVYFTPGVSLSQKNDGKDQRYRDCNQAIYQQRCDVVIVGRGITLVPIEDSKTITQNYRDAAWEAILK